MMEQSMSCRCDMEYRIAYWKDPFLTLWIIGTFWFLLKDRCIIKDCMLGSGRLLPRKVSVSFRVDRSASLE